MKHYKILIASVAVLLQFPVYSQSSGSGFFITSDGIVVTNYHVIEGGGSIQVIDSKGTRRDAQVLRVDRANDIALLSTQASSVDFLALAVSTTARRGEKVYALGFPQTSIQGLEAKLTDGIISSLSGIRDDPTTFQITNPIQPGNSGGPLFLEDGRVVGIVVATLNAARVLEITGSLPQNVNYAVKSNYLLELISSIGGLRVPPVSGTRQTKKWSMLSLTLNVVWFESPPPAELR